MADNNPASPYDFDPEICDTPVPAAEVLIDLKESARQRRSSHNLRSSPRRKNAPKHHNNSTSPKKASTTMNHRSSSRRLDFSNDSSGLNNFSGSSDEEEIEETIPAVKRPRRTSGPYRNQLLSLQRLSRPDQSTLHTVSSRLRNFLKLPKAHKWCYYEWFYSDIDQPLLEGENDFCRCLSEMFPELKTRSLSRIQWRQLRRLMGKPRRCSSTFFAEESSLVEYRRNKVRQLQQQVHQGVITLEDFAQYKDLPDQLPALLVVGTRVTARLHSNRERESGFYTGRIEAVDIENHRYWVTFERPGLGKHPVPDNEIRSADSPELISISALEAAQKTQWPPRDALSHLRPGTPPHPILPDTPAMHALFSPDARSDPFLTSSPARRRMLTDPTVGSTQSQMPEHIGGFPVDFLKQVTQLSKLLQFKQARIQRLREMNTEAEKHHARQRPIASDFKQRYATVVIDLDDMNKQLNDRLESIRSHCESLGYGVEVGPSSLDSHDHAQKITESCNTCLEASGSEVKDPGLLDLITRLTGLLLQIEVLSESGNTMDLTSLSSSLEDIERVVSPQNRKYFQDHVETPITLIQSGMNPLGTLHAFSAGSRTISHHQAPS